MADRDQSRLRLGDKFAGELHTVVSFLDPHLAVRTRNKAEPWSWRKTVAFVLGAGLVGWSVILGLAYWIYTFL